jgi:hypothetical protein
MLDIIDSLGTRQALLRFVAQAVSAFVYEIFTGLREAALSFSGRAGAEPLTCSGVRAAACVLQISHQSTAAGIPVSVSCCACSGEPVTCRR